jgi:hypothetical protein
LSWQITNGTKNRRNNTDPNDNNETVTATATATVTATDKGKTRVQAPKGQMSHYWLCVPSYIFQEN